MANSVNRWGLTRAALLERAWIWSVIGYSVLRFVVAWAAFGEHGANVWVFGIIDVVTAWPYAKAVALICRYCANADWKRLGPAVSVAVVSFLAPYVYLWMAAPSVPVQIRNGLLLFVVVMVISVTSGLYRRVRRLKFEIAETDSAETDSAETDSAETETGDPVVVDASEDDVRPSRVLTEAVPATAADSPRAVAEPVIDVRDGVDQTLPNRWLSIGRFDDPDVIPARIMQTEIYRERGFAHESQRLDDFGAFIDDWARQSVHFAFYEDDKPIGHARLIAPAPLDIPVRSYFDLDVDVPDVWEWSAHVQANGAQRGTSMELARHVISFLAFNGIGQVAMVCEPAMARLFERTSGAGQDGAVVRLCPDQETWGAVVAPRLFDIERSDPKARTHFTSSQAAMVPISDVLGESARTVARRINA